MEIVHLATGNEDDAKRLLFDLLEKNDLQIQDIDEDFKNDEGIYVLFGLYCYDFEELCNSKKVDVDTLKKHISFVSDVVDFKNETLINLIKIDFFPSVYGEIENRALVEGLLTSKIMEMYRNEIPEM